MKVTQKLTLALLTIFIFNMSTSAQSIYDLNKHNAQPEYKQFANYDKPTVDAQGNLNLQIPIFSIDGRNIDYPITFSYQSGIKVMQPSNWIGLGWNFDPGSITRHPNIGPYYTNSPGSEHIRGVNTIDSTYSNFTPDFFNVNIPGYGSVEMVQIKTPSYSSSTIPVYETHSFMTLEHKAWKIDYFMSSVNVDGIGTGIRILGGQFDQKPDISAFVITVEDGTRFVFQSPTLSYVDVEYPIGMNGVIVNQHRYVATWRLTAILGVDYTGNVLTPPTSGSNGSWVKLTYDPVVTRTGEAGKLFTKTQYLSRVDTPLFYAQFSTSWRVEPIVVSYETSGSHGLHKKLASVSLFNTSNELVQSVHLDQDNSFSPYTHKAGNNNGRLKLKNLIFRGSNSSELYGYEFNYSVNPLLEDHANYYDILMNTICIDDFGYYNKSKLGWKGDYTGQCELGYSIDSNPNSQSDAWSLNTIVYPTGLSELIEYETRETSSNQTVPYKVDDVTHSADVTRYYEPIYDVPFPTPIWLGGPRVKSIERYDHFDYVPYVYNYSYTSGSISGVPSTYFKRRYLSSQETNNMLIASSRNRAAIYFEQVTESRLTEGDRIVTHYSFGNTIQLIRHRAIRNCPPFFDEPTQSCVFTYLFEGNDEYDWGKINNIQYIKGSGIGHDRVITYSRTYSFAGEVDKGATNHIWSSYNTGTHPNVLTHTINLAPRAYRLTMEGDQDKIYYTTFYEYDLRTNLVKQKKQRQIADPKYLDRITRYEFAHDKYNVTTMRDKNMLSQHARVDMGYQEQGDPEGSIKWYSSGVTTWRLAKNTSGGNLSFWAPYRNIAWRSNSFVTGNTASFTSWTSTSIPSGWIMQEEIKSYNVHNQPLERILPNGSKVNYEYGFNSSRLTAVSLMQGPSIQPGDLFVNLWYDNRFRLLSRINDEKNVNRYFDYDVHGRLSSIKNNRQRIVKDYTYNYNFGQSGVNRIVETIHNERDDPTDISTSYTYFDGLGRVRQVLNETEGSYVVHTTEYDDFGRLWRSWKPYYDDQVSNGNLVPENIATSRATQYYRSYLGLAYNPRPYVRTSYFDDPMDRVSNHYPEWTNVEHSIGFGIGNSTLNGVSVRYTETIDEEGKKTRTYTNAFGETVRTVAAVGTADEAVTNFEYDPLGNLVKVTNPKGQVTTHIYNSLSQLTQTTSPDAGTIKYKYNSSGQLRYIQDAVEAQQGKVTFLTYDFAGRELVRGQATANFNTLDPDASTPPSFETNNSNWLHVKHYNAKPSHGTFPWNQVSLSHWNSANGFHATGQLAAEAYKSGGEWQLSVFSYFDPSSSTAGHYAGAVNVKSIITNTLHIHTFQYDLQFRYKNRRFYQGNLSTTPFTNLYEYNKLRQIVKIYADNALNPSTSNPHVTYAWTPSGQKDSEQYRGNSLRPFKYDIRDRLTSAGVSNIYNHSGRLTYQYSASGNITRMEWQHPLSAMGTYQARYNYTYDNRNQLNAATFQRVAGSSVPSNAFNVSGITYDKNGNMQALQRRKETGGIVDNLTYNYASNSNRLQYILDAVGQQHSWDASNRYYSYNANGNLTFVENFDNGPWYSMVYDERNQMTQITNLVSQITTNYRYNAQGWRYWHKEGTAPEVLEYRDGGILVATNSSTSGTQFRVLTPSGEAIGIKPYNNNYRYFYKDHIGSVRQVTNENGILQEAVDFYPFGLKMPGRHYTIQSETPEKFTGYIWDEEYSGYYAGARNYDAAIGRFMSVDPILFQMSTSQLMNLHNGRILWYNPYHYSFNNPLGYTDPDGRNPWKVIPPISARYNPVSQLRGMWNTMFGKVNDAQTATTQTAVMVVKEGPAVLDYVSVGATAVAITAGTIAVGTANPVTSGALGTVAAIASATATASAVTAATLSVIDATVLGGSSQEAAVRVATVAVGYTMGAAVKSAALSKGHSTAVVHGTGAAAAAVPSLVIPHLVPEEKPQED